MEAIIITLFTIFIGTPVALAFMSKGEIFKSYEEFYKELTTEKFEENIENAIAVVNFREWVKPFSRWLVGTMLIIGYVLGAIISGYLIWYIVKAPFILIHFIFIKGKKDE